jgi:anti-anti-sigma factor
VQKPGISTVDGVTLVTFGPDYRNMTEEVVPQATKSLLEAVGGENSRLVIDLEHTEFFGSSFIEILFRVWKRLKERGGRFALCHVSPYCAEVLQVTHLDSLWPIRNSIPEAIEATRDEV